jgi:uncharacterized protein (DUF58 family)
MLFVLAGLGVVCMHYTNNNIQGLALSSKAALPVFQGESASFPITVYNDTNSPRHAIWMVSDGFQHMFSLSKGEHKPIEVKHHTVARGYMSCPPITLNSQFPLGLLFSWGKKYQPKTQCLVYPAPVFNHPLPNENTAGENSNAPNVNSNNGDEFSGLKNYQSGDRLRDIHWPSVAKQHKLVSKSFEQQGGDKLHLSWDSIKANLSLEDKLSVMTGWVLQAHDSGQTYAVSTPQFSLPLGSGKVHLHTCLKKLALYNSDETL